MALNNSNSLQWNHCGKSHIQPSHKTIHCIIHALMSSIINFFKNFFFPFCPFASIFFNYYPPIIYAPGIFFYSFIFLFLSVFFYPLSSLFIFFIYLFIFFSFNFILILKHSKRIYLFLNIFNFNLFNDYLKSNHTIEKKDDFILFKYV